MTESDKRTLKYIPEGWFCAEDLNTILTRRDYRCQRLEKLGVLRKRVIGHFPTIKTEYCKV